LLIISPRLCQILHFCNGMYKCYHSSWHSIRIVGLSACHCQCIVTFTFSAFTHQEEHTGCKKNLSDVLAWLYVCSEVQKICRWMVQLMSLPPHHLLLHQNPDWFNLHRDGLPRLSWKRPINVVFLNVTLTLSRTKNNYYWLFFSCSNWPSFPALLQLGRCNNPNV